MTGVAANATRARKASASALLQARALPNRASAQATTSLLGRPHGALSAKLRLVPARDEARRSERYVPLIQDHAHRFVRRSRCGVSIRFPVCQRWFGIEAPTLSTPVASRDRCESRVVSTLDGVRAV